MCNSIWAPSFNPKPLTIEPPGGVVIMEVDNPNKPECNCRLIGRQCIMFKPYLLSNDYGKVCTFAIPNFFTPWGSPSSIQLHGVDMWKFSNGNGVSPMVVNTTDVTEMDCNKLY